MLISLNKWKNFYMLISLNKWKNLYMLISLNKWKNLFKKGLWWKTHILKKKYAVGTYWNRLIEAIPMCTYNISYWK